MFLFCISAVGYNCIVNIATKTAQSVWYFTCRLLDSGSAALTWY